MKGFLKMLLGIGEREYREEHQDFHDMIPDEYPRGNTEERRRESHPAYSGNTAKSMVAADYRRANTFRGPLSKGEERRFVEFQRLKAEYEKEIASLPRGANVIPFSEWLGGRVK